MVQLKKLPQEYIEAQPVIKKLEKAGFEVYFVGGSVRDTLLDQPIHDVDIATSAFPQEIKAIFPRTIDVGIKHGTVLVLVGEKNYEITTFRTESTYQDFRRPDHVEFVRSLTEDLKRRDFTINAFALKEDGTIIDLFGGLEDLENHLLRAVGDPHERFHEDALRMMRGLRFVSQLGFKLEEATFTSIKENQALLAKISVERITIEFVKMLLGKHRDRGLKMFVATGCYNYCPGLKDQEAALEAFSELKGPKISYESQAWVLLIDRLQLDEQKIRPFLKSWKCSNDLIHTVQVVFAGLKRRRQAFFSAKELYELGLGNALLVESLLPYYGFTTRLEDVEQAYTKLPIKRLSDLAINGNDLLKVFPQPAGSWLKEILSVCEDQVINCQLPNEKQALLSFAKTLLKNNG